MAIKFQYNKTSLQQLEKQLKIRVRTLPIIKNKESALRLEVKRCKTDTWLTLADFSTLKNSNDVLGKKILLVNIAGFLDFNTKFVADAFEANGAECRIKSVSLPEFERLRQSPTEMRSANIARVIENKNTLNALLSTLKGDSNGFDVVALPAVFGLSSLEPVKVLKDGLNIPVCLVPTMPPSVPGIRTQKQLRI